jgi:hypothetical protein
LAEKELLNLMNPGYLDVRFRAVLPAAGLPAAFGVVTACNPEGKTISTQENEHATDRLRAALEEEGHFFFSATGGSPDFSHSEPGFGVLFRSMKEAIAWGNRYQQEAVFWVENGDMYLVPCDGAESLKIGQWQTLAEPAAQKPIFHFLGNPQLLHLPKIALFASSQCPGNVILPTYDQVAQWRDEGRCIISGFHSPMEKECLRVLLRGSSPVIVCPARNLPKRLPHEWLGPLEKGQMMILSPFAVDESRITAELATRRNDYVSHLADEVWIAHATEGGKLQKIRKNHL